MDRASEVTISQSNEKITRRHSRQKSGRNGDDKGERFSLQGKRWRFPRGLSAQDIEARISRIRELWSDHERFYLSQVFVDPQALANLPEFALDEEAKRLLKRQGATDAPGGNSKQKSSPDEWSAFGISGRNGGVTRGGVEAEWSPLALWVAEQIKKGVQPVPLPPLHELLKSVYRDNRADYRFGHLTQVFSEPRETHPPTTGDLRWQDAFKLLNRLTEAYPSVPWTMPQGQVDETAQFHEQTAREAIVTTAKVRSQKLSETNIPLIPGTFHEALKEYYKYRTAHFS